jgi:hypothetical protein
METQVSEQRTVPKSATQQVVLPQFILLHVGNVRDIVDQRWTRLKVVGAGITVGMVHAVVLQRPMDFFGLVLTAEKAKDFQKHFQGPESWMSSSLTVQKVEPILDEPEFVFVTLVPNNKTEQ